MSRRQSQAAAPGDAPRPVRVIDNEWIELPDGVRLAIRLWLPEDAESRPVSAILDSVPYRKSEGTAIGDAAWGSYFAAHGFAFARVDLRGSGDSSGILEDEYTEQEQLDSEKVIAWLADRPWCTGAVGMIGVSWGGFATLQMAVRDVPALRGIVPIHASDDRYADDVHYIGGCVSAMDMSQWATSMLAYLNQPPDPLVVGDTLAPGLGGAAGRRSGVDRAVAEPSTPRRLLAAGLGLRGLQRDPVPGVRGRRLERRLPGHGPAPRRARAHPGPRTDRTLGPYQPRERERQARRSAFSRSAAVFRRQPRRGRQRVLRRATPDQLHAGAGRTGRRLRHASRAAGWPIRPGPRRRCESWTPRWSAPSSLEEDGGRRAGADHPEPARPAGDGGRRRRVVR